MEISCKRKGKRREIGKADVDWKQKLILTSQKLTVESPVSLSSSLTDQLPFSGPVHCLTKLPRRSGSKYPSLYVFMPRRIRSGGASLCAVWHPVIVLLISRPPVSYLQERDGWERTLSSRDTTTRRRVRIVSYLQQQPPRSSIEVRFAVARSLGEQRVFLVCVRVRSIALGPRGGAKLGLKVRRMGCKDLWSKDAFEVILQGKGLLWNSNRKT